jgi:catechol 2,3-dioxygenase-like lactoylglutathione lyase family enzyme
VAGPIESISAVTLVVADMARSVAFYESLGFERRFGGPDEPFTSLRAGPGFVNLQLVPGAGPFDDAWGRTILHVDDVDAVHARAVAAGLRPEMAPSDAPWGERYFHLRDPDGHELSFARLLGT